MQFNERVPETLPPQPKDRNAAVAEHRAHQSVWRERELGWPAGPPTHRGAAKRYPILGSCLAPEHDGRSARDDGPNLMSEAARTYAAARQQELKALGGLAEEDRLYRNLLSSQPLAFSIVGELRAHPEAAARVFQALTGEAVETLEALQDDGQPSHRLMGLEAEWFPPRELHTADQSGFDIAAYLKLSDGQRLLVTIEVKYTDSFSTQKMTWERYGAHLQAAGLDKSAMDDIVRAGGSQFLRSVLLTDSLRRRGVRSGPGVGRVLVVVLARSDDRTARDVVNKIAGYRLATPVAFWSHEEFLLTCSRESDLADWSDRLKRRYLLPV